MRQQEEALNERISLARLKELTPEEMRRIWPHEEKDLSVWIRRNVDMLNDVLGLQIEIEDAERPVGSFSLDLAGMDNLTRKVVVIENQFGRSNHDHLGKLITYAADQEAGIIIWLANGFHPSHVAALEWLNRITPHDLLMYAVKLEVFQIGNSDLAPRFSIITQPASGKRPVAAIQEISPRALLYKDFWNRYIQNLQAHHPGVSKCRSPLPQNWLSTGAGRSGFSMSAVFTGEGTFRVELYIDTGNKERNEVAFQSLRDHRDTVEHDLEVELAWQPLDEKRACRIFIERSGTVDGSAEEQEQLITWGGEWMEKMKKTLHPLIRKIQFDTEAAQE